MDLFAGDVHLCHFQGGQLVAGLRLLSQDVVAFAVLAILYLRKGQCGGNAWRYCRDVYH